MNNAIQSKSYSFAVRMVKLFRHLSAKEKEFVLSKQLLRSGTSVGANIEEAIGARSRLDFLNKMTIAYKEARETSFWLRLLKDTDFLTLQQFDSLHTDLDELLKLLTAIQKTAKTNLQKEKPSRTTPQ